jgi:hypothetical protein
MLCIFLRKLQQHDISPKSFKKNEQQLQQDLMYYWEAQLLWFRVHLFIPSTVSSQLKLMRIPLCINND